MALAVGRCGADGRAHVGGLWAGAVKPAAIAALACLKGFYLNFYPVPLHTDSDAYLESWTIRALRSLFAKSEGSVESLDARPRRAAPHESNSGATVLPLRGLALFTRPDRDITHAFFQREEHGAWDGGRAADL